jgi:hypothetical protein
MIDQLRNATLDDLATLLQNQQARKVDVIAPASKIVALDGGIIVEGAEQEITLEGVTSKSLFFQPTAVFDEGVADKLQIPLAYVRRMRQDHTDLWDDNVNGWLRRDPRSFLVRGFVDEDGAGVGRAFLSDSYKMIDHLDALTAVLDGVRKSGAEVQITKCDLTERKMYVKVEAPQVQAYASTLLNGYRSPFTGQTGEENPIVFAGFVIQNSETGSGAFSITPSMTIQVCQNGMTVTKDAVRAVHLGGKLDEGVIRWSEDTQAKTLELITLKATDAVSTFLDVDYMKGVIAGLESAAGTPLTGQLDQVVRLVSKKMLYSEDVTNGVLDHFMRAGQFTAGGVMQAVTSYAQIVTNADDAWALEGSALRALEVAASI